MDEATAEYAVESIIPARDLSVRVRASVAAKTDLGRVRENNEDKYEFFVPEDDAILASRGAAYLVCDGMGGHAAGQIASELAAKTFLDVYYSHPAEDPSVAAAAAVHAANRFVGDVARSIPGRKGMGTTLTGLILREREAWVVQVGDSRLYRLREGRLEQLTMDHTWVNEAILAGAITPEQAETHQYRHVLTRAIGAEEETKPDLRVFDVQEGDLFLLCSDGLTGHVDDPAILQTLGSAKGLSDAAWKLVGQALVGGGRDNCTVLLVRVDGLEPV